MHASKKPGFFDLEIDPFHQAIVTASLILFLSIVIGLLSRLGWIQVAQYTPWVISSSLTLLYAMVSSVLSLSTKDQVRYWSRGIMGYIGVVLAGGIIAYLFSGLSIYEAKSFSWIYIVFSVGFVLFLTVITMMRKIVEIAEKQDRRMRGEE